MAVELLTTPPPSDAIARMVWSTLEIWRGDSPFRRVLGGVVLIAVVAGLITH